MFVKTIGGEVHGRCGLVFGPDAIEVAPDVLEQMTFRDGLERPIGQRLLEDPRLQCDCEPRSEASGPADPGDAATTKPEDADTGSGDADPTEVPPVLLATLDIPDDITATLAANDPAFTTMEALDAWLKEGHALADLGGIGKGRAKKVRAAIKKYRAAQAEPAE